MKRLALIPLLLLTLALGGQSAPKRASASLIPLYPSGCTAFSINPAKALAITASHCIIDEPMEAAGVASLVDIAGKLAVIRVGRGGIPALKLGPRPVPGDVVINAGYGGGLGALMFFQGFVVGEMDLFEDGSPWLYTTASGMPGFSGGPMLNEKGEVVGVLVGGSIPTDFPTILSYSPVYEDLAKLVRKHR